MFLTISVCCLQAIYLYTVWCHLNYRSNGINIIKKLKILSRRPIKATALQMSKK